jgi:hypothetical protein
MNDRKSMPHQLCFMAMLIASMASFAGAIDESESLVLLVETLAEHADEPGVCNALMRGMLSGLEGRRNIEPPLRWNELREKLGQSHDASVRELSMKLSQIFEIAKRHSDI